MAILTPEQKEKYLKAPNQCPFCDSTDIAGEDAPETDCGHCWQNISCNDCGGSWRDLYELKGVETDDEVIEEKNERQVRPDATAH